MLVPHALKTARLANSVRLAIPYYVAYWLFWGKSEMCTWMHAASVMTSAPSRLWTPCRHVARLSATRLWLCNSGKNRGLTNFCWDDFPSFRSFSNLSEIRSNYVRTEVWKTFWKTFRNLKMRYISFPLPYFCATYFLSLSFLSNLHYFLERQVNVMQWFQNNSSYFLLSLRRKPCIPIVKPFISHWG